MEGKDQSVYDAGAPYSAKEEETRRFAEFGEWGGPAALLLPAPPREGPALLLLPAHPQIGCALYAVVLRVLLR